MRPTSRNSGMAMPTIGAMVNSHSPSPSMGKDTQDESNHGNTPPPIQTESSPCALSDYRKISLAKFNKTHPQEDTNQAEASTTNTLNNVSTIAREENRLQLNSPVSNPNKNSKSHVCEVVINTDEHQLCGQIFKCKSALKTHERSHTGEKPNLCTHCGKTFASKHYLKIHERKHTGEKPYVCDLCGKQFTSKPLIQVHMRIHTGEKSYTCDICDKRFTQSSGRDAHKKTHSPKKPFVCEICDKSFKSRSNLKTHQSVHIGNKNYQCNTCHKRFSQNGTLINHYRIHTGDQDTCDICGTRITDKFNFLKHMRKHKAMD